MKTIMLIMMKMNAINLLLKKTVATLGKEKMLEFLEFFVLNSNN